MADDLGALQRDLQRLLDDLEPLQHAVGLFAKTEALEEAEQAFGSDRRPSNWRGKVKLGAGYDLGQPVVVNLRPAGLWRFADKGRMGRKKITPKRRRSAKSPPRPKAVRTPQGWRAYSNSTPSRGWSTLVETQQRIERGIVEAAEDGMNDVIRQGGFG